MIDKNHQIEIKILDKRLREWGVPKYHTPQSAGVDLRACIEREITLLPHSEAVLIPTGFALNMDSNNICAMIVSRSGLGHKNGLIVGQGVGTIDADYLAELFVSICLRGKRGSQPFTIKPGDRIAQLVFLPIVRPTFRDVQEFSNQSERGEGGFGSTGNN